MWVTGYNLANTVLPQITLRENQDQSHPAILRSYMLKHCDANSFLSELELSGFSPVPCHVPQIQVIFNINTEGILNISAFLNSLDLWADEDL